MSLAWLWDPGLACPVTGHEGRGLQCSSGPCDRQTSHALGQLVVIEWFSGQALVFHVLVRSGQALVFHVLVLSGQALVSMC